MNQESSQNRFENLSRPKRILLLGITTVFLLFVLEIAAWGTFHIVWRVTDRAYISEEYVESLNLLARKPYSFFKKNIVPITLMVLSLILKSPLVRFGALMI